MNVQSPSGLPMPSPPQSGAVPVDAATAGAVLGSPGRSRDVGLLDLAVVLAENARLLVLGPLVAGLAAYGIAAVWPKTYTSVAYISPVSATRSATDAGARELAARDAEGFIRSPAVLDPVLAGHPDLIAGEWFLEDTPDARRRAVDGRIRLNTPKGGDRKTSDLLVLEVSSDTPAHAQSANSAVIDAWLEMTKVRPENKTAVETTLERSEVQLKSLSGFIERMEKETPTLVVQGMPGELATPLIKLLEQRGTLLATVDRLKLVLSGGSRDAIVIPPSLPTEPTWPRKGLITEIAALVALFALLLYVLARNALRGAGGNPETAAKLGRIRAAFWSQAAKPDSPK